MIKSKPARRDLREYGLFMIERFLGFGIRETRERLGINERPYSLPEKGGGIETFSKEAQETLLKDGAAIYDLTEETMRMQGRAHQPFWYIVEDVEKKLLDLPSTHTQVAFFPDPNRFYIPNSNYKTFKVQEELVERDGEELRKRLGLSDIEEIIPEAPDLTELTFKHLGNYYYYELGDNYRIEDHRLFGPYYKERIARTKTVINYQGSRAVADVGRFDPHPIYAVDKRRYEWRHGLSVSASDPFTSYAGIWAVRFIVPKRTV